MKSLKRVMAAAAIAGTALMGSAAYAAGEQDAPPAAPDISELTAAEQYAIERGRELISCVRTAEAQPEYIAAKKAYDDAFDAYNEAYETWYEAREVLESKLESDAAAQAEAIVMARAGDSDILAITEKAFIDQGHTPQDARMMTLQMLDAEKKVIQSMIYETLKGGADWAALGEEPQYPEIAAEITDVLEVREPCEETTQKKVETDGKTLADLQRTLWALEDRFGTEVVERWIKPEPAVPVPALP